MIRLSRAQLREVDRLAVEQYAMPSVLLMENAARSAVDYIATACPELDGRSVTVVCGKGNNGGDGYAVARHLANRGAIVRIFDDGDPTSADANSMCGIAEHMAIERVNVRSLASAMRSTELWIDAIFGTGLSRPMAEPWRTASDAMNASGRPIVALDIPSGLDCDSGEPLGDACVRATLTVSFVAEKVGFANARAHDFTGDVVVGDIGCPSAILHLLAPSHKRRAKDGRAGATDP